MNYIKADFRGATCADSVLFAGKETNDCTVRALASASGMHYEKAHALLKKNGRKDRCGARFYTMKKAYNEANFSLHSVHGTTIQAKYVARITSTKAQEGITLGKLLPKLTKGSFIVNVTGHAVAVVNGELIDTFDNPAGKRVIAVFKRNELSAD